MSQFEFSLNLTKAEVSQEVAEPDWRFVGLASTGGKDRQRERVSAKAVASMNAQAMRIPICIGSSHEEAMYNPLTEVGVVDSIDDSDPEEFKVMGYWDKLNPNAAFVHGKLSDPNGAPDWKLSIGGKIRPSDTRIEFDNGESVRVIDDMLLDHIYLCRGNAAVNQETAIFAAKADVPWTDAIFKAAAELSDDDEVTDCAGDDGAPIENASFSEKPCDEVGTPEVNEETVEKSNQELPPSLKGKAEEDPSMSDKKAMLERLLQFLSGGEESETETAAKSEVEAEPVADAPAEEPAAAVEDETPVVEYVAKADFDAMAAGVDEKLAAVKAEILEAIAKASEPVDGAEDPIAVMKAEVDGKIVELDGKLAGVVERFEKALKIVEDALETPGESAQPETPVAKASVETEGNEVYDIFGNFAERHSDWIK